MTPDPSYPPSSYLDQHAVETPEQMMLRFPLAGIGSRFLAMTIDTLIQFGVGIAIGIFLAIVTVSAPATSTWTVAILVAVVFLLTFGYFAFFEIIWNGQTPGKRVAGIRVVKDSGRTLTPVESIGRNLLRLIDQLPGLYIVGIVVAMCNAQNKRLGDLVAGSIVVREHAVDERTFQEMRPSAPPSDEIGINVAGISEADLLLIDTFLARRATLPDEVRRVTALRILERISVNLPPRPDDNRPVETVLEAIAYQRRSTGR